jgi:ribonucleotide monophosphatase NagD (HAD superfamily)
MTDFKSLLENYRIIFFDAYGVIINYKGLIPGIEKTFDWLNELKKSYYVITNDASRSPDLLAASYHNNGLMHITPDKIISSGMLAKEFLDLKVKKGLVAYLGTEDSAHYIEHPVLKLCRCKKWMKVISMILRPWYFSMTKDLNGWMD